MNKIVVVKEPLPLEVVQAKPKFLIVEDDLVAAVSMRIMLERAGYEVQVAHDGETGLKMAKDFDPAIILLDLCLPKIDGFMVAKTIREAGLANAHIIAVTALASDEDRQKSDEAGIDYHMVKPIDHGRLDAVIRKYLKERFLIA